MKRTFTFSARRILVIAGIIVIALGGSVVAAGLFLAQPFQTIVGPPPPDLDAQAILIPSPSGSTLYAWLSPGKPGVGFVVLMHGVRANRLAMEQRALVLNRNGFGVLLFDFQAHGESPGHHITFGKLEGLDATAAITYARNAFPTERVGAIGVSLGGAAALLGPKPLNVDALIIESVFPDIHAALANRLRVRLGGIGAFAAPILAPPLEMLLSPVLGVSPQELRPIDRIEAVTAPLLVMSGTRDLYTPIDEAQALFAHAPTPKIFWAVDGAAHVDLERYDSPRYWDHVLPFLTEHLQKRPQ